MTIYVLRQQSDLIEGKGPMVDRGYYESEEDAWTVAETMYGPMGYRPKEGWRQHYLRKGYGSVVVEPISVEPISVTPSSRH